MILVFVLKRSVYLHLIQKNALKNVMGQIMGCWFKGAVCPPIEVPIKRDLTLDYLFKHGLSMNI